MLNNEYDIGSGSIERDHFRANTDEKVPMIARKSFIGGETCTLRRHVRFLWLATATDAKADTLDIEESF